MSEIDALKILEKLATVFPDWAKWSATVPRDTSTAWTSALMTVEAHHVNAVIADWQFGRRTCPQTFERERVVYMAVEAARQLRSKEYERETAKEATKSYHAQAAEAAARRAGYTTCLDKTTKNAYMKILAVKDEINKPFSQWTGADHLRYRQKCAEIVESYARTLDKP